MAGLSVQFVGIGEVLKAFEHQDCIKWSVCQGKALNFSYAGTDENESRSTLEEWLKMIGKRPNQAVYTLKFYEDYQGNKITAGLSENCSFNFRLSEPDSEDNQRSVSVRSYGMDLLLDELRNIKSEVAELKAKQNEPARITGVNGEEPLETWEKILDHPLAMAAAGKIFGLDLSGIMAADGKLSGVPGETDLYETVERLKEVDPNISDHLAKLLLIAEKNPGQFKVLISMLEKM